MFTYYLSTSNYRTNHDNILYQVSIIQNNTITANVDELSFSISHSHNIIITIIIISENYL